MKNIILSFFLVLQMITVGQTVAPVSYIKEVRVNWDNKLFMDPLPIDEPFVLVVYSNSSSRAVTNDIPPLTLVRYIKKGFFYYYDVEIQSLEKNRNYGIASVVKTTSVIASNNINTNTTTSITQEFNGDPGKIGVYVEKYNVPALRANFYYSLMETTEYNNASLGEIVSERVEDNAKANTFLSKNEYANRKITAIFGVAGFDHGTTIVRPYLGFRYNFFAINNAYQAKFYEEMHNYGFLKKHISRTSLDLGVTIASINDSLHNHYDLFATNNLVTGIGYKISNGFFISAGALWYYTKKGPGIEEINTAKRLNNSLYVSLSFDWDFGKSFDVLKKGLGFEK